MWWQSCGATEGIARQALPKASGSGSVGVIRACRRGGLAVAAMLAGGAAGRLAQAGCLAGFVFAKGPVRGALCNSGYNFFKCFTNDGGNQTNNLEAGG